MPPALRQLPPLLVTAVLFLWVPSLGVNVSASSLMPSKCPTQLPTLLSTKRGDKLRNFYDPPVFVHGDTREKSDGLFLDATGPHCGVLYVRLCPWEVYHLDTPGDLYGHANMTRYCYCLESNETDPCYASCSIPGPTIWMNGNSTATITIVNEVRGCDIVGPEGYPTADPTEDPTADPTSSSTIGPTGSPTTPSPPKPIQTNTYKDMDITNFHTHGLHISPWVDNIFESTLPNGGWHAYPHVNAAIQGSGGGGHYPGTYWYHSHHHGTTAWQVSRGLYGTILMNPHDTFQGKEYNIGKYKQNVLMFDYQYFIPADMCMDTGTTCWTQKSTKRPYIASTLGKPVYPGINATKANPKSGNMSCIAGGVDDYSLCNVYCQFPDEQRSASHYRYDVATNISYSTSSALGSQPFVEQNLMRWFVNGQYQPVIEEVINNEYQRLRFVNSMSNWFLQMRFPTKPNDAAESDDPSCTWYLIGTDGVYFTNQTDANGGTIKECKKGTDGTWTGGGTAYMNYPLDCPTHNNNLLIAPGGRADVLFKCTKTGTYTVTASSDDGNTGLKPWVFPGTQLFDIAVKDPTPTSTPTIPFDPSKLPQKGDYPVPAADSYLEDTSSSDPETGCQCYRKPKAPASHETMTCHTKQSCDITFNVDTKQTPTAFEINNMMFDLGMKMTNIPTAITFDTFYKTYLQLRQHSLFLVEQEKLYEFQLTLGGHVYHQHINPFQMREAIGGSDNKGRIALNGAWHDTIGSKTPTFKIRTWTRDFGGIVITHCHLLQHEDKGMMSFYGIVPEKIATFLEDSKLYGKCWDTTSIPKSCPTSGPTASTTSSPSLAAIPTSNETGIMNAIADLKDLIEDIGVDVAEDLIKDIDEDTPSPVVASAVAPHGDTLTFSGWISEGLYFFKIPDHFSTISVMIVALAIVAAVTVFQWYSRWRKQQKPYKRVAFEGVMPSDSESDVEAAAPMNL